MKVIAVIVQKSGVCKDTPSIATTVAAVADRLSAVVVDLAPPKATAAKVYQRSHCT